MKKQSDVWVLVVTILNLPPDMRSKVTNIIIPLVIPGPSSPGNVESFVYVLYEELAKLSIDVWAWDALSEKFFLLKVFLCGVLGDMLVSRPCIFYRFIWIYSDLFDRGFVSKSLSLDMIRSCHVMCCVTFKPFVQWHMTLGESCHSHTDIHDWIDKPRA
jgi:hypothetical protein